MASFEFRSHTHEVTIAGHDFTVVCNSDTGDVMKELSVKSKALTEELRAGTKGKADAIALCKEAIDRVLGDGSFDTIFTGREVTLTDASDVILFLTNEIAAFNRKNMAKPANREQRRAAQKK